MDCQPHGAVMRQEERVQAEALINALMRWMAKREITEQWKAQGNKLGWIDPVALAIETNKRVRENRVRLREQAVALIVRVARWPKHDHYQG